jgi:WS/DGAT/MGAT family acyltransferase
VSDRLTPLDATFLELEQADECAHMHIGGVMVFDPQPGGGAPPIDALRRDLESRLDALPRFRQRLSAPRTGGLSWPRWERADRFDIAGHVSAARLPGRGSDADLREWASRYYSERLDRSRPLWEMVLVDGLEGGRWAIATKTHHCMVDGVGSVDAAYLLLDGEPDPPPRQRAPAEDPAVTDDNGHRRSRLASVAEIPASVASLPLRALGAGARQTSLTDLPFKIAGGGARAAQRALDALVHAAHAREAMERSRALADVIVRDELVAAPRTSINVSIGGTRRIGVVAVPLDELKRIKRELGGTVNDVVLAAAAGALRRMLEERGEDLPADGLRAMVPVNVRDAGQHLSLGNRITSLFVHLPVDEHDPLRRYERQMEEAESLKSGTQALGASTIIDLTSLAPPAVHSFLARSLYATRLFNLTITNVPGPQQPLYALGSRMREVWPIVPLAAEHAVGLAVLSYAGQVFFTVNADYDTVPDLDVLMDGLRDSIAELSAQTEPARGAK